MPLTPILLNRRLKTRSSKKYLVLSLSAEQRTRLRGPRNTICGQEVLLKLPREGPLMDGDLLAGEESSPQVLVKAAEEDLCKIQATSILELIKAAYHLGNRHVDLELHIKELFLVEDPVLITMLEKRGLKIEKLKRPFFPEMGAYDTTHSHKNLV